MGTREVRAEADEQKDRGSTTPPDAQDTHAGTRASWTLRGPAALA
jgi:hypothetical protein